jgi:two-component sensor histidine kinase
LINDLLDISRISRGKLHLEMRFVDLASVIDGAVESVRDALTRRHLELDVHASRVVVGGDPSRLHQVVVNLLGNAVQYTPDGGAISVTLTTDGDHAMVTVHDTGAGIDPAFLPRVFDQFRQGEGRLSRKHGGLGLGLSVVKQLVELHDGRVAVESRGVGLGATFSIVLPREAGDHHELGSLLLHDLTIGVAAADDEVLADLSAILEASGARVRAWSAIGSADTSAGVIAALVHSGLPVPVLPEDVPAVDASSTTPAELVRRIARLVPRHTRA